MEKYIMLDKAVGETPLSCAEAFRQTHPELDGVSMAYAGRLDPMASGKLLVLLGDECKNQTAYHGLDKAYEFSVLLGIGSDSHDVLGRLTIDHPAHLTHPLLARPSQTHPRMVTSSLSAPNDQSIQSYLGGSNTLSDRVTHGLAASSALSESLIAIAKTLIGNIELPYPHFSAKTVQGKPLHMWTLEGRLGEIEIPTKASTIYALELNSIETKSRAEVCAQARVKIDSIHEVTEARKALGNDFRRVDVRKDWENVLENEALPENFHIAHFTCIASSGTYMRTLAHLIGQRLNPAVPSLAWRIHRTQIGTFHTASKTWSTTFE